MTTLYVDADACPVKEEVYRVAARIALPVVVVSNSFIRVPREPSISLIVVEPGPDVADNWIAERATSVDIVITADIPLADRALKKGAQAIHPDGRAFTPDNIGTAIAARAICTATGPMWAGLRWSSARCTPSRARVLTCRASASRNSGAVAGVAIVAATGAEAPAGPTGEEP